MLATQSVSVEMPRKRLLRLIAEEAFLAAAPLRLRLELLVFWTGSTVEMVYHTTTYSCADRLSFSHTIGEAGVNLRKRVNFRSAYFTLAEYHAQYKLIM
jgi:hypothetical protein